MIKIKSIVIKNFMSIGAVAQAVSFADSGLTLVLGENVDLGGGGSRNGVGKTSLLNAISYGLFGIPIASIKQDNLINRTNQKNLLVSIEFEKGKSKYKIERGRKPNIFKFLADDQLVNFKGTNETQGEGELTQKEVERVLGFNHIIFKNLIGLSAKTERFLDMGQGKQRELIEQILGITQLSEKAKAIKDLRDETKREIEAEQIRINTIKASNEKIQSSIKQLEQKRDQEDENTKRKLESYQLLLSSINNIDVDHYKKLILENEQIDKDRIEYDKCNNEYKSTNELVENLQKQLNKLEKEKEDLDNHKCFSCGQVLHDEKTEEIKEKHIKNINDLNEKLIDKKKTLEYLFKNYNKSLEKYKNSDGFKKYIIDKEYNTIEKLMNYKEKINKIKKDIEDLENKENTFQKQIDNLKTTAIQEIDYELINELTLLHEHQEFLHKLLTSKDSVVRKKIIDQNIPYLNSRLRYYLDKMGMVHQVKFQNDLSVEILHQGKDLDYDNLSTGEQTRVVMSLFWSFRDIYESLNGPISLMFIDEMLDAGGLDGIGIDSSIDLLKKIARERKKDIFLVSHREELISRLDNILTVSKLNNFTHFSVQQNISGRT